VTRSASSAPADRPGRDDHDANSDGRPDDHVPLSVSRLYRATPNGDGAWLFEIRLGCITRVERHPDRTRAERARAQAVRDLALLAERPNRKSQP
jgi:hypothetical protein